VLALAPRRESQRHRGTLLAIGSPFPLTRPARGFVLIAHTSRLPKTPPRTFLPVSAAPLCFNTPACAFRSAADELAQRATGRRRALILRPSPSRPPVDRAGRRRKQRDLPSGKPERSRTIRASLTVLPSPTNPRNKERSASPGGIVHFLPSPPRRESVATAPRSCPATTALGSSSPSSRSSPRRPAAATALLGLLEYCPSLAFRPGPPLSHASSRSVKIYLFCP